MKARILVVEDEFFISQDIVETLDSAGFAVLPPCSTVPQALAELEGDGCDAAVLDASLRNESSLPVAQALAGRGIPFAVVTGFSTSQLPPELAGAPVITKPLNAEDLISVLGGLLTRG
ncbi:response regulator [Porphyrobacter sp. AAP60]|uniref:response regulator n=1 Tax=Porphyrobacter sp. AAP60 TaxID=1523423 RepID=UPI0006B9826C|nr:response regulator [Porphyrobacter sp. AAP60]KPF63965.1 hypothetical protein IP79_09225 [Porphyrobacter sp. AAP60]